ncbi:MAG TPA: hypothetical protein VF301_02470 [Ginsengibacter sp.]
MQERAEKDMEKDVDLNMERNQEMIWTKGNWQDLRGRLTICNHIRENGINIFLFVLNTN